MEGAVFQDIKDYLLRVRKFERALAFLHILSFDPNLDSHLKHADIRTKKRLINRHDKLHALTTTRNALQIFDILFYGAHSAQRAKARALSEVVYNKNRYAELTNENDRGILENIALVLIISAYCHDIGRPFVTDHPLRSFQNSEKTVDFVLENRYRNQDTRIFFRNLIYDCVTKHEASPDDNQEWIEEGIVTVADFLDNTKERIIVEESEVQALLYDPDPIEFFSCRDIQSISAQKGTGMPLLLTYRLSGHAGTYQLTIAKRKLRNTKLCNLTEIDVYLPADLLPVRFFPCPHDTP
jgi:metal-dependent HD superfamily phosphatase/phosphodiesterase